MKIKDCFSEGSLFPFTLFPAIQSSRNTGTTPAGSAVLFLKERGQDSCPQQHTGEVLGPGLGCELVGAFITLGVEAGVASHIPVIPAPLKTASKPSVGWRLVCHVFKHLLAKKPMRIFRPVGCLLISHQQGWKSP